MSNWLVSALFCVGLLVVGGGAGEKPTPPASAKPDDKGKDKKPDFRAGAVRYQVKDVDKSVEFYTKHLDFEVEQQFGAGAAFASVSNGNLTLWLSGGILLAAALAAGYGPAWRASRIDPWIALRDE